MKTVHVVYCIVTDNLLHTYNLYNHIWSNQPINFYSDVYEYGLLQRLYFSIMYLYLFSFDFLTII